MNRIIAGVLIMLSPCAALAQEASTAADQVPIEEYVPKVIIESKWGTGPGEFGMASQFPLGYFEKYQPSSLAVDSKGNIYILDFVNDRIQKFNKSGKYLTELPVEGLKGELAGYCDDDTCYEEPPAPGQKIERKVMGQVEVQGINIVIDSKDDLYYYLKRVKDGKETGEVWEFRNDKLVKKTEVPAHGGVYYEAPLGLILESDDSIWIFNIKENNKKTHNFYEVKSAKKYDLSRREEKRKASRESLGADKAKKVFQRRRALNMAVTSDGIKVTRTRKGE
ncbi:MAG TPA: hypothetical protein PKK31_03435 [Elusimicrobiales bacterium]|nr:hypothetical protein [Elusimicrobiales bacterium]